ncbi:S-2-hydroxy-acid oxidase [Xylariomycetidae sp. FL2044]|nr:S-2-hydroxy-acid oxidase [Xylariomycetidae sp. FL2044]
MRPTLFLAALVGAAIAAEPFLNEPDTGLETYLFSTNYAEGRQPLLKDMRGLPDFEYAARQTLNDSQYSFYRTGTAGEWSYRNNLEIWSKVKFRPRQLSDVTKVGETLNTTIMGYDFSAPIFIAPAARGGYCDPDRAELNLMEAAGDEDILYLPALYATKTIEEIAVVKSNSTLNGPQVVFQQIYSNANISVTWDNIKRAEAAGAKAIVWTIDAAGDSTRHRAARYDTTNSNSVTSALTWDLYELMASQTDLPIIPKGISTVEDALTALKKGIKTIYISNHGGRQVDHSPSPLEIAYEIKRNAPRVFQEMEVLADSGIRYGTDVLKLLTLGVKAVGLGRPFMYANCYGREGVAKAIQILKAEIAQDAAQIGITNVQHIPSSFLNTRALEDMVYLLE